MSKVLSEPGIRRAIGFTSTTRASAVRQTALNAAEPSAVIRLTVADGTNDGGISGAGGGEAGACADAANSIIAGAEASAAHTMRLRRVFLRIGLLPFSNADNTNQHSNVAQG